MGFRDGHGLTNDTPIIKTVNKNIHQNNHKYFFFLLDIKTPAWRVFYYCAPSRWILCSYYQYLLDVNIPPCPCFSLPAGLSLGVASAMMLAKALEVFFTQRSHMRPDFMGLPHFVQVFRPSIPWEISKRPSRTYCNIRLTETSHFSETSWAELCGFSFTYNLTSSNFSASAFSHSLQMGKFIFVNIRPQRGQLIAFIRKHPFLFKRATLPLF
jgi:hypothetical protein